MPAAAPVPSRAREKAIPRVAGVDGLRALAVLAVIAFHLAPATVPGGFIGVDVFFVISGFLITRGLLIEPPSVRALGQFWSRRARRILSALIPMLLVCGAAVRVLGGDPAVDFGRQLLSAVTFSTNWVLIGSGHGYFATQAQPVFQHLWSLAVEEQFYLLWPVVIVVLRRVRSREARMGWVVALAAISVLTLAVQVMVSGIDRGYFGTDSHGFGLVIGALVAMHCADVSPFRLNGGRSGRGVVPAGLVALVVLAAVLSGGSRLAIILGLPAVALITAVMLWALTQVGGVSGRLLDAPPWGWIGRRSYGLYLWHWPVLVLLRSRGLTGLGWDLAAVAATVALAAASYRWVEQPIQRAGFLGSLSEYRAVRQRWIRPAVAVGAAAALSLTSAAVVDAPRMSRAQAQVQAGIDALAHPNASAPATPEVSAPPIRIAGAPVPAPGYTAPARRPAIPWDGNQITAVGDSVMLAAAPALLDRFPGIHIDAEISRQPEVIADTVRRLADSGQLRRVVVVGMGTNGTIGSTSMRALLDAVGSERELVLVTPSADRSWIAGADRTLREVAAADDHIRLMDWARAVSTHPEELAGDGIHPGPAGGRRYAALLAATLTG
ncbi:acyltransferase family protein [Cellulomonas sp. NPDC089187]|uniref:acyltransferase family protein n=1 Tax=Cellulomonas sp. NPDC089187 TaxID=3154970 RepID=UPI00343E731C